MIQLPIFTGRCVHFVLLLLFSFASIVLVAPSASAQWATDAMVNNAIADRVSEQVTPKISPTPDGGCYVAWFDLAAGSYDVYLQRIDAQGVEAWAHNGVLVSDQPQDTSLVDWDILTDSSGACVVVFTDTRAGGDRDVYAYRVLPDGTMAWGANGIAISADAGFEAAPQVAELTTGDFIVSWFQESSAGIRAQRIDPTGQVQYAPGGIKIGGAAGEVASFCQVVASDAGSYIVSFVRDISSFFSPRHVHVQKFDATGAPQWGATPVVVYSAASIPIAQTPKLGSDGAGGAIVTWHVAPTTMFNAHVQHVDATGAALFPTNGVTVSTDATRNHLDPSFVHDPATGDTLVFWNERNSGQSQWGIRGQKIDLSGQRQWGNTGVSLLPLDATLKFAPRAVAALGPGPSDFGAMVFVIDEPTGVFGQNRVVGMRVDGTGAAVWPGQPLGVSTLLSPKARLPVTLAADGAALCIWEDGRSGAPDVYGQRVDLDGQLGPGNPPASFLFIRGQCNEDSAFNIADAIRLLGFLFPGANPADPLPCPDACDSNDDGAVNIADAISMLSALFGSPPTSPAAPFPSCGTDPTGGDPLDCPVAAACP